MNAQEMSVYLYCVSSNRKQRMLWQYFSFPVLLLLSVEIYNATTIVNSIIHSFNTENE